MASIEKFMDMAKLKTELTEGSQVGALTAEAVMRDVSPQLKRLKRWGLS
jgi:hypothetical protein